MNETRTYDVFLSYAVTDREWVRAFSDALKAKGLITWFDVANLPAGARWQDETQEALRARKTLIAILSPQSVGNPGMFFELGAAIADRKRIIPVLTEDLDIQSIPPLLRQFQALQATSPEEAGQKVADVIAQ
jgi:limonene-1,2-epoxide hydrolase